MKNTEVTSLVSKMASSLPVYEALQFKYQPAKSQSVHGTLDKNLKDF